MGLEEIDFMGEELIRCGELEENLKLIIMGHFIERECGEEQDGDVGKEGVIYM